MRCLFVGGFLLLSSTAAAAEDCASVIALSKINTQVLSDRSQVEQHAANFCSEYRQYRQSGRSVGASASYKFLAGSFNSSSASVDEVASRYCSADASYSRLDSVFRNYVESIAPGAFVAYEQCLQFAGQDITFRVDPASVLPQQFVTTAYYRPRVANSQAARLKFSASDGVNCRWDAGTTDTRVLQPGSTGTLNCRRTNHRAPSFVALVRTDGGDRLTLPWQAYNADGIPVNTVAAMTAQIASLENQVSAARTSLGQMDAQVGSIPMKAVGTRPLLDNSQCPTDSNAQRGELNGRVNFARPFAETPAVQISLSHLDIGQGHAADTHRIYVGVTQVDRNGFNYTFNTWCTTKVYGATAAWIAVSP